MRIKKCRICSNKNLEFIGSLGKIAISNFTDKPMKGTKFYLTLVYCDECGLLQLDRNFNRKLLYEKYWYKSGLNPVIEKDLKEIAKLYEGDVIIDIGSNDGTLLKYADFKFKFAVDPSDINPGVAFWYQDYWENVSIPYEADVITSIACLYDLPTPNKFIRNVKDHLASSGVFISQFQPLSEMVELNDVGNICHEHLEYYSYRSLVRLFEQNGLEIFKVETNKINGGSYRLFARHFKKGSIKFKEKEYGIRELEAFFKRIEENKKKFLNFVSNDKIIHLDISGYGASTKANTIMQYYGVKRLDIVDINPEKKGKYPVAQTLPVIDKIPKGINYLWVFPYGFIDYFKKKEKGYKGKWITTIPEFKII